jgi:TonB family protein
VRLLGAKTKILVNTSSTSSTALVLIRHQSPSVKFSVILAVALCLSSLESKALDACSMLSRVEVFAALSPTNGVTESHSTDDTPHLSTCGYESSNGVLLVVIISNDLTAYDNAQRKPPQEKMTETPVQGLGERALLWDSKSGVQVMAAAGQKFVRVALMKQPQTDPAAARKIVIRLVREALTADWGASTARPTPAARVLLRDPAIPIYSVPPAYPPLARQARVQGQVVLTALIGRDGSIENLQMVSGHPMLVPAAMHAVEQWKYKPYLVNSQPVEVEMQVCINFSLSGNSGNNPANPPSDNSPPVSPRQNTPTVTSCSR